MARDPSGTLHVVFAQRTESAHPVWHAFSQDDGATWSEPAIVRDGVAAYSPWVAPLGNGSAAIQFFGSLDPAVEFDGDGEWHTFWATAVVTSATNATHLSGTTTAQPAYEGPVGQTPEFNMVRTDTHGRMHLGLSIPIDLGNDNVGWGAFYQRQTDPAQR